MKALFFLFAMMIAGFICAFRFVNLKKQPPFNLAEYKMKNIVRCNPDWGALKDWLEETSIPPIPGAGIYKWKISTTDDSAQFYFNQGINMYYSFHIIEAMASFKKAAKFDPDRAILYWAQALSYGPNINDYGYRASPEALAALDKAKEFSSTATPFEKSLVDAISARYTADSTDATRAQLNQAYADKMKKVYEKFSTNPDAQALYADAMMLQHPWDLWFVNGDPKPWTPAIREVLEKLLAGSPDHPGGNHYYIHVMEPSPYAAKALPSADRLGKTNPGLSHVVHMPSHIYLRTGLYQKGVDVNINAVNSYKKSIPIYTPVTGADFLYIIHNLHMKTNNAMMLGNYKLAAGAAMETRNSIPVDYLSMPAPMGNVLQYIYMTPVLNQVRFGKWDDILQEPQPDKSHIYSSVLYHFARSIAHSRKNDRAAASKELDAMREFMKDSSLSIPMSPFSAPSVGAQVAEQILLGVIHEDKKLYDGAIRHYKIADSLEINMVYNEPRDWLLNPKHFLGNACLLKGDGASAETIFKKHLQYNNENGWALYGLHKALLLQKKTTDASKVLTRYKAAFSKSDTQIPSSVY
ncbi:MAG TPA: tetratricopeptide repeat protein [Chitinophagaceae bacterium]|nr:tetratricopeptide repeat protein [Chitinophagaceae bacterium]